MTDTTPVAAPNAINTFFSNLKAEWQVVEEDVITLIQNIGAEVEVAAEDISWALSWLGGHITSIAATVTAVQNSVVALNAAGVPIPNILTNAVSGINQVLLRVLMRL